MSVITKALLKPSNRLVLMRHTCVGVERVGICVTAIVDSTGNIVHNDHYLTDEEKVSGKQIAICVSRLDGGCLTLDL